MKNLTPKYCIIIILLLFKINIFCQNSNIKSLNINSITIIGNKKTNEKIILNELTFKIKEEIIYENIDNQITESINNLNNKSLFNYIDINYIIDENEIDFTIIVEERWYLWPTVSLNYEDRNFSSWLKNNDLYRTTIGFGVNKYNFRGLNQKVAIKTKFGYIQNYLFSYENLYLDKKNKHLISLMFSFKAQHQINYSTINNKPVELKVYNDFAYSKLEFIIIYRYRQTQNITHSFFLKNEEIEINDSIYNLNENYLGGEKKIRFFHLLYEYEINKKDNKNYPLLGYYLKIGIKKNGIIPNFDEINTIDFKITATKFFNLYKRLYFATHFNSKLSFPKKHPFFNLEAVGYNDNIRGFEYYVIDGNFYFLNNNSLKYNILKKKIFKIRIIPLKKFNKIHLSSYISLNFDYGYVLDLSSNYLTNNNYLTNQFLYSTGIGIDFVSYYDKVLRIEYSITNNHDRGLYLSFKSIF